MLRAVQAHPETEEGLCWPEESPSHMENGSTATGCIALTLSRHFHFPPSCLPQNLVRNSSRSHGQCWALVSSCFPLQRNADQTILPWQLLSTLTFYIWKAKVHGKTQRTEMSGVHSWMYHSYRHFMPTPYHVMHVPAGQAVQAAVSQHLQCLIKIIIR